MKRHKSLAFLICFWTGLALVVSVGLCIGTQLLLRPERRVAELALHDMAHVLVIGLFLYATCIVTIKRVLLRPLNEIFFHLYEAGKGQPGPLHLDGGARELQTVVDGINAMVWRMEHEDDAKRRARVAETEEKQSAG